MEIVGYGFIIGCLIGAALYFWDEHRKEEIALTIDNEINNLIKERNDLLKTNSDEIKNSIRENNKLRESYTSLLPTLEILNGKDGVGGLSDKTILGLEHERFFDDVVYIKVGDVKEFKYERYLLDPKGCL